MKQKILILGAKGMLGGELVRIFECDENYEVIAWDKEDIDVTDHVRLKQKIDGLWPDIICNAIAYNAVDACEDDYIEQDRAIALNTTYPETLAKIAKSLQAVCVHYSTDYVFDGERPVYKDGALSPSCCGGSCRGCMYRGSEDTIENYVYVEDDLPKPLSRYGQTKYDGEQAVSKCAGRYYIIRLSKLFGMPAVSAAGKKSFFDVMLEKGQSCMESGESIRVVDGEVSKFTYAPDLALETKAIIEDGSESGVYHIVNDGACTWFDAVLELYALTGINVHIEPVTPETFQRPAPRPRCSVLGTTKRETLRHYKQALAEYLELSR